MIAVLGVAKRPTNGLTPQGRWYEIKNISDALSEVYIYDFIGDGGVTPNDFIHDFSAIKSSNITLRINSPGGDVFDGLAIYNAIKRHKATVTAFIDGIAASAASFIAMAADKVVMSPHAQMLIHDAHGGCIGNAADMRDMFEMLDKASNNIAGIYARKAGGTVDQWRAHMLKAELISDQEAVDLGLADAIDGQEETPRARNEAPKVTASQPIDWQALINAQQEAAADVFAA